MVEIEMEIRKFCQATQRRNISHEVLSQCQTLQLLQVCQRRYIVDSVCYERQLAKFR